MKKGTWMKPLAIALCFAMGVAVAPISKKADKAKAAAKLPELNVTGGIEDIGLLTDDGMAQEVGKTIKLSIKGVKKGNVKDLTVFVADPRIASVSNKTITKKKSGFKVKINKLGETYMMVRIILKKKQAGQKMFWKNMYIRGVRKMSKKELAAFSEKYAKANTHSALLDRHENYRIYGGEYQENGELVRDMDIYETKEDIYVRIEYGNTIVHTYSELNSGYEIINEDGKMLDYYFFDPTPSYFVTMPMPDDPEELQVQMGLTDPEYGYYDGSRYYYSEKYKPGVDVYDREEMIIDGKTYEMIRCDYFDKTAKGKEFKPEEHYYENDVDMPDIYHTLKYQYRAEGKKKVKVECIIDPGTPEERRISGDIPEGAPVYFESLDGYGMFSDAEGKIPISEDEGYDTGKDQTVYYIKTAEDTSAAA